jgi:hypothetical protein
MLSNWGPGPVFDALKGDLARFGYVEGKNVVFEARFPEVQLESFTDTSAGAPAAIDKILKGAKPADMPFELVTRREFVINLELGTRSRLDRSCRSPETCRSCHRIKKCAPPRFEGGGACFMATASNAIELGFSCS